MYASKSVLTLPLNEKNLVSFCNSVDILCRPLSILVTPLSVSTSILIYLWQRNKILHFFYRFVTTLSAKPNATASSAERKVSNFMAS
jgi:predicted Kef-type K+ transport protein